MVSAICSKRASVMLGQNSGLGALVKANAPHVTVMHCLLNRHALAAKTFLPKLAKLLKIVVECGNYVQNSAMKHRIFKQLCNETGSEIGVLLYYTNVRWISWGKMLNRVFVLLPELAVLLLEHQDPHADVFKNSEFILVLACMVNIFVALNNLNQQMQGGRVNIIKAEEQLKAFKKNNIMKTKNGK